MTLADISLTKLRTDADFLMRSKRMGLETLADIMETKLPTLRKKKDFSYIWYASLLELLKEQGLLEEFERRQL